jgi:hypothetical protein
MSVRKFKRGATLAFATTVALAGALATGSPAMAASSPIAACGGGSYHVIDKHDIGKSILYLLYNGSTNCVVNWKKTSEWLLTTAAIKAQGDAYWQEDLGQYQYYAGPVKRAAAGKCIQWGGLTDSEQYFSGWEHCG